MIIERLRPHRVTLLAAIATAAILTLAMLARLAHGEQRATMAIAGSLHTNALQAQPALLLEGSHGSAPLVDAAVSDAPTPPPALPPAADIPDPESNPGGFIDAALLFWRAGGKVPVVLVGLIGLLAVLRRRVKWLGVGWRVTAVGVVGVLAATLLDTWLSSGAAGNLWSWLFGGLVGVVNFLANPKGES